MKAIKLALTFLRIGVLNEIQYRINFFLEILQSFIALGTGLIALYLVFSHTTDLNGWNRPELLAVMGVHILMGGLIRAAIQPNMQRLVDDIQEGTLDFPLTKPFDAQLIVSVREFRLWQMVDFVVGLVVLAVAVIEIQSQTGLMQTFAFAAALVMGGIMIYCFWMMLTSTAFWIIRVYELVNLFEGVYAAGRWPVGIYPNWMRFGLTFLMPVAFAVTVPAEALIGRLTPQTLLTALGLTLFLLALSRLIWRWGIRSYAGASA